MDDPSGAKAICGLGNPGAKYEATRHNVGWWVVDRLSVDWDLGPLRREDEALGADGRVRDRGVRLMKPLTYMNRSGLALAPLRALADFDPTRDLLVIVDDVALDLGRLKFRPRGSAGGHNGLKSIEAALGTREYARLRIGVGKPPEGVELVDWVLSEFSPAEEDRVLELMPEIVEGVGVWLDEGMEAAMNRYNR